MKRLRNFNFVKKHHWGSCAQAHAWCLMPDVLSKNMSTMCMFQKRVPNAIAEKDHPDHFHWKVQMVRGVTGICVNVQLMVKAYAGILETQWIFQQDSSRPHSACATVWLCTCSVCAWLTCLLLKMWSNGQKRISVPTLFWPCCRANLIVILWVLKEGDLRRCTHMFTQVCCQCTIPDNASGAKGFYGEWCWAGCGGYYCITLVVNIKYQCWYNGNCNGAAIVYCIVVVTHAVTPMY